MRNCFYGLLAFCLSLNAFSQLTVTPSGSANTLAQNIAGNGVTVSNAVLNCGANAAGTFSYVGGSLGIPAGIILTTGDVTQVANSGTVFTSVLNGNMVNDPQLMAIDPLATNDVCILEFDLVPICSQISITFVFGSEEYPAFVNSTFNDAFGIFLTGPNPGGGTYNSTNIGTLPNGTPVSINNVHAGLNSTYFVDNYTAPNNHIVYDGYTTPVTSTTPVAPCSTYHMKIAIADAGDQAYDSGVFVGSNAVSCQNAPVITATATPAGCGGNTGSATATVTNYTGTTTYSWQPGGQTTQTINNLAPGTYTCIVGLQMGCGTFTSAVTATVNNTGVNLNVSAAGTAPACNNGTNGSATVTVNGGTAPYTYSWNTTPIQTSTVANNLSAGVYSVTVTDNGGCVGSATVSLANPAAIVATATATPSQCSANNGTAGANIVSGGTAPFSYAWSCVPIQTTQVATNLAPGSYTVVISDVNTCTAVATASVGLLGGAWTLTASTPTNVSCFNGTDGAATFVINNPGSSTFTYSWNSIPAQTTQVAGNLAAGNYTCSVSDNTGCTQTVSVTVTQPTQLTVTVSVAPTICTASVGSATSTASGGSAPYTYSWNTSPAQSTANAINLPAGTFVVTVTDSKGCTANANANIATTVQTPVATGTVTPSKCGGPSGGVSITNITGGNGPFTYNWNSTPAQTSQSLLNVMPGNYVLTMTDVNGCVGTYSAVVNMITGLPLTISSTADICNSNIGSATVTANGNPPYQYTWSTNPQQTTATISNVPAGSYFVVVTDAFGCTDGAMVSVNNVNETMTSSFSMNVDGELLAGQPVTMSIGATSGWVLDNAWLSDGSINFTSNVLTHTFESYGAYYVTYWFTSPNGCRDSVTYPIIVTDFMTLYIPNAFSPNGDGINDNFRATGTNIKSFEMLIYDRWGMQVKSIDNLDKSWDGTYHGSDAIQDVYVYKGKAVDVFNKTHLFVGEIRLVR